MARVGREKTNKIAYFKDFYSCDARIIGASANRWKTAGTVVGVSDGIVNVLSSEGVLITLTAKLPALSPYAILLDDAGLLAVCGIGTEASADLPRGFVTLSNRGGIVGRISLRHAVRWSGRIRKTLVSAFFAKIRLGGSASLRDLLARRGSPEGLLGLVDGKSESPAARFARKLAGARRGGGVKHPAASAPADWLGSLVGLGPGLTPSGDDFLAGCLLAKAVAGEKLPPAAAASIRGRFGSTTPAGRTLLEGALDRRFPYYLHEFVGAWAAAKGPAGEEEAVAKALSHGSTSGTDALAGLVFGLD